MPEKKVKLEKDLKLKKDFEAPSFDEWKEVVEKDLKGASFEKKLITKTYEGIDLQPIYTSRDLNDNYFKDEFPGLGLNLRGANASGYKKEDWKVLQELDIPQPEEVNNALKNGLKKGLTGINLSIVEPEEFNDEQKGVYISELESLKKLFFGIDLANVPVYLKTGYSPLPFLILFSSLLKVNKMKLSDIHGSIEADPIGYLAEQGELPVSFDEIFDEFKVVIDHLQKENSNLRAVAVNTLPYHNSGASAVQELAFTIATGVEYLNQLIEKGVSADEAARRIRFTFGIGSFYFMEIAKLRAARALWSTVTKTFGISEDASKMIIHARTSSYNQTKYDPYVNMLRTTSETFSAILGGADSIHSGSFDEAYGLPPTQFSERIARNTQIILNEESHLSKIIDPSGGSYFVESLTKELSEKAWDLFKEVENKGGIIEALKAGFPQKEILKTAQTKSEDLEKRKSVLVGTNKYANLKEVKPELSKTDYKKVLAERKKQPDEHYKRQKRKKIESLLSNFKDKNIIEAGIEAVDSGATLEQIRKALNFGEKSKIEIQKLSLHRAAEAFEKLRDSVEDFKNETGSRPKVFLINMGNLQQYKARADFSTGFFEVGGFKIVSPDGFDSTSDAIEAAINSNAKVFVICSTDETYPELVPQITKGIKEKLKDAVIVLAGYPKEQIEEHKKSGIDEFIYLGANVYKILSELLRKIGVVK